MRLAVAGVVILFSHVASAGDVAEAGVADSPKIWPVEAFAALPFMEGPELSPDGRKIAAKIAIKGKQQLVIDTLGVENSLRTIALGENDLNWWTWVNDDWLLIGIGAEQVIQGQIFYLTRSIGIKADGSKMNMLAKNTAAQHADDVIWVARDGTPRILLAYQTSIYQSVEFWPKVDEVDVSTGRMRNVVPPQSYVRSWYADATGTVRLGVGYNDGQRTSMMLYRTGAKDTFRTVARANRRRDESLIVPRIFMAEPGKAIASDGHEGHDALYEFDLNTLELGKKIFEAPGYDLDSYLTDATGTALAAVRYTDDRSRTHWFDADMAQVQAQIDKAVGARRANIISSSRDMSKLLVHVGGPDRPGAYYYYNRADGAMQLLARVNEIIGAASLAPMRTIHYKARDGLDIPAILTVPEGRDAKNLPLILMPHGGPIARDREEWDWWVQFLVNRGYAVIQPNYRGSSGFGAEFLNKGEGQWGLAMQDDLNDAVDWAVQQGVADPKRVCIVGASYGGYAALRGAQRDGGRFRCAISYAGVSDLGAIMRYDRSFLNGGAASDYWKERAEDFRDVSPIFHAAEFSTPTLIMHGKKDRRVLVGQSREMVEKLKAAGKVVGKDYVYVEQPLGDHHFSRQEDRLDFLQRMEAFLKEHNPA